jgi:hypothetical protein
MEGDRCAHLSLDFLERVACRHAAGQEQQKTPLLTKNVGRGSIAGFLFLVLVRTSRRQPLVVTLYTSVRPWCDLPGLRAALR